LSCPTRSLPTAALQKLKGIEGFGRPPVDRAAGRIPDFGLFLALFLRTCGLDRPRYGFLKVEQAFRSLKTVDLQVRPIYHWLAPRVRAHVSKAQRLPAAHDKQTRGVTPDGLPVHSFRSLLADLATLTRNTVVAAINPDHPFTITASPTPLQQKAFDLLGVIPERTQ
jgi:hypothetical protein